MALASAYWLKPSGSMKSWNRISPGCTGASFLVFIYSMVIHNFNVVRVFTVPAEANAPWVVDADAVLSGAIAFQGFQAVAGRQGQVTQFARALKPRETVQGRALKLGRQPVVTPPLPQPLCLPASEAGNHRVNLSFHDNMSSWWCARVNRYARFLLMCNPGSHRIHLNPLLPGVAAKIRSRSPVAIRALHGEGVRQVAHFPDRAVLQEHLHNVEANLHGRVLQQAQVIERGSRKPLAPLLVHRRGGAHPFLGRAGLDFDEHEAVPVAEDQVDLAPR